MKNLLLYFKISLQLVITGIVLTGCSSVYNVNKYSSSEEYYNNFNNSADNEEVTLILKDEHQIKASEGALIKNDTIYSMEITTEEIQNAVPLTMVKTILRSGYDSGSGDIILNNDQKYNAKKIGTTTDSVYFTTLSSRQIQNNLSSLDEVKSAKYKNRWLGVPFGMGAGILAGGGLGLVLIDVYETRPDMTTGGQKREHDTIAGFLIGAASGAVIGGVIGWLTGYSYEFRF